MNIKTVLGDVPINELGITLSHEHICCYNEYIWMMAKNKYLDKEKLIETSVKYLKELKSKYSLNTFIDCTPINIGRNIELLKEVSKKSGVNIICCAGFYYTEELVLYNTPIDLLSEYIVDDAKNVNAGIIKCAIENEEISGFNDKLLRASARAQLKLKLPIILHTNANNKSGLKALDILLSEGVAPQAITVGHLSDTTDLEYIKQIADKGCFVGFDRLYGNCSEEYISKKVKAIIKLCSAGYEDKILLSHDALFFNGFEASPTIYEHPRFSYCFEYILPRLSKENIGQIMIKNPSKMLKCGE